MNNAYLTMLGELHSKPWALQPSHLKALAACLSRAAAGQVDLVAAAGAAKAESELRAARGRALTASTGGAVAVIPLYGCISHRGSFWSYYFGGSSVEGFRQNFRQAMDDASVKAVVIDVDSPGGSTDGVEELSAEIYAARGKKKITAVSNCLNASAAIYISSAADKVVVSPSSLTGSIGVYCAHEDDSELLKKMGVQITLISYGKNKTNGNPYEPLPENAKDEMQAMVDYFGEMFDAAMARNRGVKSSTVAAKFGQGKVFNAKEAVLIGMADEVGTLESVLASYGAQRSSAVSMAADIPAVLAKADDETDDPTDECQCDCAACMADDCSGCTVTDCADPNCKHADKSTNAALLIERDRMSMQLAF